LGFLRNGHIIPLPLWKAHLTYYIQIPPANFLENVVSCARCDMAPMRSYLGLGVLQRTSFAVGRKDGGWIRRSSGNLRCEVRKIPGTPDLPEGYRLDLLGDPDAPALRRPDGTVVARFAAAGATPEAIEREALEDLAAEGLPTAS
jgi:hypothetical protein